MARTNTRQFKLDAQPLYAGVGVVDLAVEYARGTASGVQARISKVDFEPKALRDQARTIVVGRVDGLSWDAKEAQAKFEARVANFQSDAKKLPAKVESFVNETVAEAGETYGDLAARGKDLVNRIRRQQATRDAKAAVNITDAKVKTARTQTTKSAKSSATASKNAAKTTTAAAKQTGTTARTNTKATSTSAKKAASATTRAAADGASKVGN